MKNKVVLVLGAIAMIAGFQNCAKTQFKDSPKSDAAPSIDTPAPTGDVVGHGDDGGECSITKITIPTKMLFVVDMSGSNAYTSKVTFSDNTVVNFPPTDPTKSFRAGVMQKFLDLYKDKSNFSWGLIGFAAPPDQPNGEIIAFINNNGDEKNPRFSKDPQDFQSGLNNFKTRADKSFAQTPYKAAQEMAIKAIQNDPDLNAADAPQYLVIFLTDGLPTDQYDSSTPSALVSLASPGRIKMSIAYYTSVQNGHVNNFLSAVAKTGGGVFQAVDSTNWSSSFKIDDVIPRTDPNCPIASTN
ncbi:MAG: vWA domain-containing protein [Pseudobdellovibrionaceae bacterium]